jgi:hypothetical protein
VEGFEPPYGGIKTRDAHLHSQQLADLADPLAPSTPFGSPSLPPELPLDSNAIDDEKPGAAKRPGPHARPVGGPSKHMRSAGARPRGCSSAYLAFSLVRMRASE